MMMMGEFENSRGEENSSGGLRCGRCFIWGILEGGLERDR